MPKFDFKEQLIQFKNTLVDKTNRLLPESSTPFERREKIIVFVVSMILALFLWTFVNLSRIYTIDVRFNVGSSLLPSNQALLNPLPDQIQATVGGEGWKLLSLYFDNPSVELQFDRSRINLMDQVNEELKKYPGLNVKSVEPTIYQAALDQRISKKIPVIPRLDVKYDELYGAVSDVSISPDSVTISGAQTLINGINFVETQEVELKGVEGDVNVALPLLDYRLITKDLESVQATIDVEEFTEGKVNVPIEVVNQPLNKKISFSPTKITITYDVPISLFQQASEQNLFSAKVDYSRILADTTGFLAPSILINTDDLHVKYKNHQPTKVIYFETVNK